MTLAMDRNFFSGLVVRLRLFPLNTSSLRGVGVADKASPFLMEMARVVEALVVILPTI